VSSPRRSRSKRASGKLDAPGDIASWIADNRFTPLSIDVEHAVDAAELPPYHRDPLTGSSRLRSDASA
jgi:PIN domain nuclease of toxin-antitoxin system